MLKLYSSEKIITQFLIDVGRKREIILRDYDCEKIRNKRPS